MFVANDLNASNYIKSSLPHSWVHAAVAMLVCVLSTACDCGAAVNGSIDASMSEGGNHDATSDTGEALDPEAGMVDGDVADGAMCGTTSCCDPSQLPPLSPVTASIILPHARPIVFEPAVPHGTTSMNVSWVGSSETDGVSDMEFAGDAGAFHARLAVLALPPVVPGQSLRLEIQRPEIFSPAQIVYDERLVIREAATDTLLAAFVSQGAGPDSFRRRSEITIDPFLITSTRVCQGPVAYACDYQTELFDLWFSIDGSEPVVAGQGEVATLTHGGQTYRVMNRQTLDDGGDEASKGSCGFISGAREFDIVLTP